MAWLCSLRSPAGASVTCTSARRDSVRRVVVTHQPVERDRRADADVDLVMPHLGLLRHARRDLLGGGQRRFERGARAAGRARPRTRSCCRTAASSPARCGTRPATSRPAACRTHAAEEHVRASARCGRAGGASSARYRRSRRPSPGRSAACVAVGLERRAAPPTARRRTPRRARTASPARRRSGSASCTGPSARPRTPAAGSPRSPRRWRGSSGCPPRRRPRRRGGRAGAVVVHGRGGGRCSRRRRWRRRPGCRSRR